LKSDWTSSHPFQPEIESYWQDLSQLHSLQSHIRFGIKVEKAVWDPSLHLYHITTEDTRTGERTTTDAQVLISAIGLLEIPQYPEIPGLATFRGTLFHSARWETDFDFKGKRVAVIGNGASACVDLGVVVGKPAFEYKPQDTIHSRYCEDTCDSSHAVLPDTQLDFPARLVLSLVPSCVPHPTGFQIRKLYSWWAIWAFKYIPFVKRFSRFLQYLEASLPFSHELSNLSCRLNLVIS